MRQGRERIGGWGRATEALTLLLGLISFGFPASADSLQYSYDQLGRVIESVNTTSGQVAQYNYDAAGNITAIKTVAVATLSVAGFSPSQGPIGAQVVISGSGFNATASANTVKFNGTTANVSAATTTQLTVTVPAGATTGTVSVTNTAGTATSSGSFTIITAANAPTISAFTPTAGPVGTPVTITGTNYQPQAAYDQIFFNGQNSVPQSASSTNLTTNVPVDATSGRLQVATPFGAAISSTDFIIPPPGFTTTNIGTSGRVTTNGTNYTTTLSTANQIAVELFDGTTGQYLTLGILSNTISSATLIIYTPNGKQLLSATITSATTAIQLPILPATGTYSVVINPGANTGAITWSLALPLTGALTINGSSLALAISPAGRRALITFSGAAGEYIVASAGNGTLAGEALSILNPDGSVLDTDTFGTTGGRLAPQLPTTGTYTLLINPSGAIAGNITVSVASAAAATLSTTQAVTLALSGQTPGTLTFNGATGQYFSLVVSEVQGNIQAANISVVKPDGSVLATSSLSSAAGCGCTANALVNLGPLPMTGTYSVAVTQTTGSGGSVTVSLINPLNAQLPANSAPTTLSVSSPGQGMLVTFSGTAGSYLDLNVASGGAYPWMGATISIVNPDGTVASQRGTITTNNGQVQGAAYLQLGSLPLTGTYTIVVQQSAVATGSLVFTLAPPLSSNVTINGGSDNVTVSTAGQDMILSFTGASGAYLTLTVSQSTSNLEGTQYPDANITVYGPDGSVIESGVVQHTCSSGTWPTPTSCSGGQLFVNMGPLQLSGKYRIVAQQMLNNTGTLTFDLSSPLTGTLSINGSAVNESITHSGQSVLLKFSGTAGQYLALSTIPQVAVPQASLVILDPNGIQVANSSFNASCGGACTPTNSLINVGPLTVTGTYSVLMQQYQPETGNVTFQLTSPFSAQLTVNGTATSETTTLQGQGMALTFSGVASHYVGIRVSETNGNSYFPTINLLSPSGLKIASQSLISTNCSSGGGYCGSVFLNSGALPSAGVYTVLIQMGSATDKGTLTVTLTDLASATSIASSLNPAGVGQAVTLIANPVGPLATATGKVSFLDGVTTLGTSSLVNGITTYSTTALALGPHSLTAAYAGDTYNAPSVSSTLSEVVASIWTSSITLTSSLNPSVAGNSVTFTAGVTGNNPTGTITFKDGQTTLGTSTLASGTAAFTTTELVAGSHSINAVYSGNSGNTVSTSATLSQVVKAASSLSWASSGSPPSSTISGQTFSVKVQVVGSSPTGTVTFLDGATILTTAAVTSGVASVTLAMSTTGARTLAAQYSGDANNGSSQLSAAITVNSATDSLTWSSAPPSSIHIAQTFPVQVKVSGSAPTGTVSFLDGTTTEATASVVSGSASTTMGLLSTAGTHTVTAKYSGDSDNGSASLGASVTVTAKATPTLSWVSGSAPPTSVTQSQSFRIQIQVSGTGPSYGSTAATGSVTFLDGSTTLTTATLSSGIAAATIILTTDGSHTIVAQYSGDSSNVAASLSAAVTVNGKTTPTMAWGSGSAPPTSATVGQQLSLSVQVTGAGATSGSTAATGTVTFLDGSTALSTATLNSGIASTQVTLSALGAHTLVAQYSGDSSNNAASLSASVTIAQQTATVYWITAPFNPATESQGMNVQIGVRGQNAYTSSAPTGTVKVLDGVTQLASASLVSEVSYSEAYVTVAMPTAGSRMLTVNYSGDAIHQAASFNTTISVVDPNLSVSPTSVSFGNQVVSTTSSSHTVTITNNGSSPVDFNDIEINNDNFNDFTITSNSCGATLAVNSSCTVSLTFNPVTSGSRTATLSIMSDAANGVQNVALAGIGLQPNISVSPSSLVFPNEAVGTSSPAQTLTVTNTGTAPLNLSRVGTVPNPNNPPNFTITTNTCMTAIAVNQSCIISVAFTPLQGGLDNADLEFEAPNAGTSIFMTASGIMPSVSVSSNLFFSDQLVGTISSAQSITVTNNGSVPTGVSVSSSDTSDFPIASNGCTTTLAVNQSCVVTIKFSPVSAGVKTGGLYASTSYGSGAGNVSLQGAGVAPAIGFYPIPLVFGNEQINTRSASQTVTITNTGTAALTISSAAFGGANATDFSVTSNGCTSSVSPNGTCTLAIAFTPLGAGARSATLQLASNVPGGAPSATLDGTGIAPAAAVSPANLNFSVQAVGFSSAAQTLTVTNSGTTPLTVSSVTLSGGNPSDFSISAQNCTSTAIPVNGACSISAIFKPVAVGNRSTSLLIASNATNGTQTAPLTGAGVSAVAIASPSSLTFASQQIGSISQAQTITVTNTGTAPLTFTTTSVSGSNAADFTVTSNSCSGPIDVGQTCSVGIAFAPAATGGRTATVQIASNASNGTLSIPISGTGAVVTSALSPLTSLCQDSVQPTGISRFVVKSPMVLAARRTRRHFTGTLSPHLSDVRPLNDGCNLMG